MAKFICKICGKEFDRVGNGVYCNGPHFRPCPVCGKLVEFWRPSDAVRCCSKECVDKLANQTKSAKTRICKECGKEFHPRQASQIYCEGPHRSICVVCGKEFEYTVRPSEKPNTCSIDCQSKLRVQTTQIKYGVDNVSRLDFVKQKISDRNGSEEVKEKRRQTSLRNWGVDNPAKSPEISARMSAAMSSEEYLRKREETCLARYGSIIPMRNKSVQDKRCATNMNRYGQPGHPHSRSEIQKRITDGSKVDNFISFKDNPSEFISSHFDGHATIVQLEQILGVTDTPIYDILIENNCRDMLVSTFSYFEDSVVEFLKEHVPEDEIIRCDRKAIKPYELDIYLPKYNLGIECNPVCTHNSSFVDPWGQNPKDRNYHRRKSLMASDASIFLFHVFGYEWVNHLNIIKSMLLNLMNKNSCKIGARSTYVDEITYDDCKQFLNENHRQGNCGSSIRLGLRVKGTDELVSVMTFGRLRHTMGRTDTDKDVFELSRFCNKLNTNVSGGASKLFKYFLRNNHFDEIISFSDISHTKGTLYEILGFQKVGEVPPSYTWVDKYDQVYYNRVSCQKSNLRKLLKDPNIDIVNHTEVEIMQDHGFAQVYDSGKIKWAYQLSK